MNGFGQYDPSDVKFGCFLTGLVAVFCTFLTIWSMIGFAMLWVLVGGPLP